MINTIVLKKFQSEEDFSYYSDIVFNKKLMKMNYGRVFTLEEAQFLFNCILERGFKHTDFGEYKVFEESTHSFIGICSVVVNQDFSKAEIEYALLPDYWNQGYGSRIAQELLSKVYEVDSIHQVMATTSPDNIASRKILLNNGFESQKIFEIDDGSLAEAFVREVTQYSKIS